MTCYFGKLQLNLSWVKLSFFCNNLKHEVYFNFASAKCNNWEAKTSGLNLKLKFVNDINNQVNTLPLDLELIHFLNTLISLAQSAGALEYTDCFSAEGYDPPPPPINVLDMTLNYLMVRFHQCWSFGECGVPLHYHCTQVHSGLEW